jgi:hypothetical protein
VTTTPAPSDPAAFDLEVAAVQAIAACGGDAREEAEADELRTKVSRGYARGRLPGARERKD